MQDPSIAGGIGTALDAQVVTEDNVGDLNDPEAETKVEAERLRILALEKEAAATKVAKLTEHLAAAEAEAARLEQEV